VECSSNYVSMSAELVRASETLEAAHFNASPAWRESLPGLEPRLSELTALQYFQETTAGKPGFYELDCDNERVHALPKLQPELARLAGDEARLFEPGRWSYDAYAQLRRRRSDLLTAELLDMRGHQYELMPMASREEGLQRVYVVQKVRRKGKASTEPLALYTIVDGVIRRVPDLYTLIESRLTKCAYHLTEAAACSSKLAAKAAERTTVEAQQVHAGEGGEDLPVTEQGSVLKDSVAMLIEDC